MRARHALPLLLLATGAASLARAQDVPAAPAAEKKTGFIGIQMDAVAVESSPVKGAVRVLALVPGSPAEGVGVKPGDLILALDGQDFAGVPPRECVNRFRERLKPFGPGEKVRLFLQREQLSVATKVAGAETGRAVGTGPAWNAAIPNVKKLVEDNPGKPVTVSAERATWTREVTITLIERPGTTSAPLPDNASLRPDLEALALAPEVAFAQSLVERLGLEKEHRDLRRRLEEDEKVDDAFRLRTVRYLKRDPWRLPTATRALGRALAPTARGDVAAACSTAALYLDAEAAPILTTQAPAAPPLHSTLEAHVDYCLALMRRSRDLVRIALAALTPEEQQALERDLPTLADKFKEGIYLHEDEDPARWKRHSEAVDLLAKVNRAALIQGLAELAPLADPAWLDRLGQDLREAEGRNRGFFNESPDDGNGWLLHEATTDLGRVAVGGSGTNGYRGDFALVIDLAGDDRYYRRAGAAWGLARPVAVSIDLDGDDTYQATEPFSQGAALLGVGLLVDRRGNDRYTSMSPFSQGATLCGAAALVDLAGNDAYRGEAYSQGSCLAQGTALLLDGQGDDEHEAALYAQGFGGPGGFGALVDRGGNDHYAVVGHKKCSYGEEGVFDGFSQGAACGFRSKASGGIGALVHEGGNDLYEAGNFSQGCGYYFGWGCLCDLGGGDDRYEGSRYAQGAAAHSALGSLQDDGGDDRYRSWVAAAQSLAWDLSVTALLDEGGNDRYDGGYGLSQAGSAQNGFALFFDASGQDRYSVHRKLPALAGPNDYHGGGSLSLFVDAGGEPNVYDVGNGVAFVPSRGIAVSGDRSVLADLPCRVEGMTKERLDALLEKRQ